MEEEKKSVFETLNGINVNDHVEKKNSLSYLSWAWAHATVKRLYPKMKYKVFENESGWNYFTDGRTCWVKTSVTIEDEEIIEYLPVMDFRNASIPLEKVTSFDVNKAIQRCLTKNMARFGLGLYIYAGEDLPEDEKNAKIEQEAIKNEIKDKRVSTISEIIKDSNLTISQAETWAKKKYNTNIQGLTEEQFNQLTEAMKGALNK